MSSDSVFVRGHLPPRGVKLLRRMFAGLYWMMAQIHVSGIENLPSSGGLILATNHLSMFDVPLIFSQLPYARIVGFAGDTWRRNFLARMILESVDVIWVSRGATTPSTMKIAVRVLQQGYVLGVAPEGTRSRDSHALLEGRTGTAYLSVMANVPIVPVALTNTEQILPSLKRLRRAQVGVTFGKPFTLAGHDDHLRHDAKQLKAHTDEIMCRIAALLPPNYRGFYSDHPRLLELLSTSH